MMTTNNNRLLIKLTSSRWGDWWLRSQSIWWHFSAELSQKHLIGTSDPHHQPDEEGCFKVTYSLSWLMVINDQVRLADWGQLSSFEWLLKNVLQSLLQAAASCTLRKEQTMETSESGSQPICHMRGRIRWSDRLTVAWQHTHTHTH